MKVQQRDAKLEDQSVVPSRCAIAKVMRKKQTVNTGRVWGLTTRHSIFLTVITEEELKDVL